MNEPDASQDEPASKNAELSRPRGRPFAPGNPGGPGRKAGSRNTATLLLDAMAEGDANAILARALDLAKEGDMRAIDLILSRIWPPRKGRPVQFDLPSIVNANDVLAGLQAVIEAASRGELTPEEATVIGGLIDAKRKAIETLEFEQRLAKLEAMQSRKEERK